MSYRTGIGWDSHRLVAGRPLILGGVQVESDFGLDGHSDADVLTHAVIDALLGAAGLGDIGAHFPDTDPQFRDADSVGLLRGACALVSEAGFAVENVDATVMLEAPKIGSLRDEMRSRLAEAMGLAVTAVNVKATTGEGMDAVGRGEGAAAIAIATLRAS
ncbi:MAG: 2-C-methyl-D-erythritol 2,4-cyclodiphosphate synthase [Solirubrobacteraceae bacterium]|nr:2-C-methyl-D-erythritol 2,4-cyclodiphosphate synthase [Solirubrobacteraceae bacterium]